MRQERAREADLGPKGPFLAQGLRARAAPNRQTRSSRPCPVQRARSACAKNAPERTIWGQKDGSWRKSPFGLGSYREDSSTPSPKGSPENPSWTSKIATWRLTSRETTTRSASSNRRWRPWSPSLTPTSRHRGPTTRSGKHCGCTARRESSTNAWSVGRCLSTRWDPRQRISCSRGCSSPSVSSSGS